MSDSGAEFDVVASVLDSEALIEATGRLKPDLIIVDVFMPTLNGMEAVTRLAERSSAVPS